jgi:hypothetical protein
VELVLTQALLLDGVLAVAEPKTLRCRPVHVAVRIVRHARQVILRLRGSWPWATQLAHAFARLRPSCCAADRRHASPTTGHGPAFRHALT